MPRQFVFAMIERDNFNKNNAVSQNDILEISNYILDKKFTFSMNGIYTDLDQAKKIQNNKTQYGNNMSGIMELEITEDKKSFSVYAFYPASWCFMSEQTASLYGRYSQIKFEVPIKIEETLENHNEKIFNAQNAKIQQKQRLLFNQNKSSKEEAYLDTPKISRKA